MTGGVCCGVQMGIRMKKDQYQSIAKLQEEQTEQEPGLPENILQKRQTVEPGEPDERNAEKALKELIGNLISFRDNQLIKRGLLYEQGEREDSVPLRMMESILKETASLLAKSGVEIMEDTGMFSSDRQTIIDTIETEDETLDGMIAEVISPGYCYQGEPLRGQEVIVYKKKD